MDIYLAASQFCKYPILANSTSANNCYLFVAFVHVCSIYPHITVTWDPIHHRYLVSCKLKINLSKTFKNQEGWLQKKVRPEDDNWW